MRLQQGRLNLNSIGCWGNLTALAGVRINREENMTDIKPNQSLNFPGVEDRVEIEYGKETKHDDYTDDTQGDPEGAEVRASYREERNTYPDWVLRNYQPSKVTAYGKPWTDGQEHLIPRPSTVNDCVETHKEGMTEPFITNCLAMGVKHADFQKLRDRWIDLIDAAPTNLQFEVMRGLQSATENALARRAISRNTFNEAADNNSSKDEYVEKRFDQAMKDATMAGMLVMIHRAAWQHLQWKNEPQYNRVDNAILLELTRTASFFEKEYGSKDTVSRATLREYGSVAVF